MIQLLLNTIVFDSIFAVDAYTKLEVTFHEFSDENVFERNHLNSIPTLRSVFPYYKTIITDRLPGG
jgi:hypothetical protein